MKDRFVKRFIKKVADTIDLYQMVDPADHIVCAVSGGADSTALLYALFTLKDKYGFTLSVAHVNHNLRGEQSKGDAKHTQGLAKDLKLKFHLKDKDVRAYAVERGLNIQMAGREVRGIFFDELIKKTGAAKIATGHTATDNGETHLMRLIVGAGPEGLSGIPPVRFPYIRPLIAVARGEVEEYLEEMGIGYVTDSSNLETKYLRNLIRNEIIPKLKEINPEVEANLAAAALEYRNLFEIVKSKVELFMEENLKDNCLSTIALNNLPKELRGEAVKMLIFSASGDITPPLRLTKSHITAVLDIAQGPTSGERSINLPGGIIARRSYDRLFIISEESITKKAGTIYSIPIPGTIDIPILNITISADFDDNAEETSNVGGGSAVFAIFDMDKLKSPLTMRTRRDGDRFYPAGGRGSKKLKDYFIDKKLPKSQRDTVPILLSDGEIIWILGHRVDGRFVATEDTKRRLKVSFSHLG
jgi:tRNA(Ile)-lysidine synthase